MNPAIFSSEFEMFDELMYDFMRRARRDQASLIYRLLWAARMARVSRYCCAEAA
jgi:hypothetical protein